MSKEILTNKEILIMNETLKTMAAHASVRKFKADDVTDEILFPILNAARQAPTSSNMQAYSIIVIRDKTTKETLASLCNNQGWIKSCPVFLAICPDLRRLQKVAQYRKHECHDEYIEMFMVATVDAALVAQNILLGAESCGLGGVMIGAIRNNPDDVCQLLKLPNKVYPLMGMCLGWPATKPMIKPRLQDDVIIHREHYGDDNLLSKLKEYDEMIRKTGLYDGPNRKVASPDGRQIPDEEYSWTEHTARRLAATDPVSLRSHMREFLLHRDFRLE
jgi:FMN reductase [NAD(P)H]